MINIVIAVIGRNSSGTDIRSYSDYYSFGMVLRSAGENYRYGYQAAYTEKDGESDWNAFELRMYDSRIAQMIEHSSRFFIVTYHCRSLSTRLHWKIATRTVSPS